MNGFGGITAGSNLIVTSISASTYYGIPSGGGSTTPGGSDTQIQFNDGGSTFGGNSKLTYNKTTNTLSSSIGQFTAVTGSVLTA